PPVAADRMEVRHVLGLEVEQRGQFIVEYVPDRIGPGEDGRRDDLAVAGRGVVDEVSALVPAERRQPEPRQDRFDLLVEAVVGAQEEIQVVRIPMSVVAPAERGTTGEKKVRLASFYASQDSILERIQPRFVVVRTRTHSAA